MMFGHKVHKQLNDEGDPKTHPTAGASNYMTSRPGDTLADMIYGVVQVGKQLETDCTEDLIAKMEEARERIITESKQLII